MAAPNTRARALGWLSVGGLLIGVVYSLTSLFFPQMAQVAVFSLLALVLLVRPAGLLGSTI